MAFDLSLPLIPREKVAGGAGRMRANLPPARFSMICSVSHANFSQGEKQVHHELPR